METLHRLAGVQEASNPPSSDDIQPPQPVSAVNEEVSRDATADHSTSTPENTTSSNTPNHSQRASRASLPLNRKPSHKSFRSTSRRNSAEAPPVPSDVPPTPRVPEFAAGSNEPRAPAAHARAQSHNNPTTVAAANAAEDDARSEDFVWGPTHPCFPHPNPHVLPSSPEYAATRVIRVRRDYLAAGDMYPAFANVYPEILEPLLSEVEFRMLVTQLNLKCKAAFAPGTSRAWLDSLLGAATGFLSDDLGFTGARKGEKEIEGIIDRWNREKEREGKDVQVVQLRRTGFMSLDFVVPDPGVDETVDATAAEEGQRREG